MTFYQAEAEQGEEKWNKEENPCITFSKATRRAGELNKKSKALSSSTKSNFDSQSCFLYFSLYTLVQLTRSPAQWYLNFDYYRRTAPFVVRRSYLEWKIEKHMKKCERRKSFKEKFINGKNRNDESKFIWIKVLTKSNTEGRTESKKARGSDEKICRWKQGKDPSRIMENNKNQHYRKKCSRKICIFIRLDGKVLSCCLCTSANQAFPSSPISLLPCLFMW